MKAKCSIPCYLLMVVLVLLFSQCAVPIEVDRNDAMVTATSTTTISSLLVPDATLRSSATTTPTTPSSIIVPIRTPTLLPPLSEVSYVCPTLVTDTLLIGEDRLFLWLDWEKLYKYDPGRKTLDLLTRVKLDVGKPHLSPDGKKFYWIKDNRLVLFDVDHSKILRETLLPQGTGIGAGWTEDGKIKLENRFDQNEKKELTAIGYEILDPEDFHVIREIQYELNYPSLLLGFLPSESYGFLSFHPDGDKVLYSGNDDRVYLYDVSEQRILWRSEVFFGVQSQFISDNWTRDGKWAVFAVTRDEPRRRFLYAISEDGSELKELAVLENPFLSQMPYFSISPDKRYLLIPLWRGTELVSEPLWASMGSGYLLDLKSKIIKPICAENGYFINGMFSGERLFYNILNNENHHIEVWVLNPEVWEAQKLFDFSTNDIYDVIGINFTLQ